MPSSLIFTGLVVLWLLILVPAVARHQQEVARPSGASLAGRVLARPGRRGGQSSDEGDSVDDDGARTVTTPEVWVPAARRRAGGVLPAKAREGSEPADEVQDVEEPTDVADMATTDDADPDADPDAEDGDGWERPTPRYRPGRGGFDPEADAETARRRYGFRQRVVLTLLVVALLTGVAAAVTLPVLWWAHGAVDLALVGYLIHLRRQVREEASIRERRAARMAGTRRTSAADDHDLDDWARRGREATRRPSGTEQADAEEAPAAAPTSDGLVDEIGDGLAEDGDAARVRGVGEPIGLLPARRRGLDDEVAEPSSALPPLQPVPPPPLPPGTSLVEVDDDELDLHDLGTRPHGSHRRAVGE